MSETTDRMRAKVMEQVTEFEHQLHEIGDLRESLEQKLQKQHEAEEALYAIHTDLKSMQSALARSFGLNAKPVSSDEKADDKKVADIDDEAGFYESETPPF